MFFTSVYMRCIENWFKELAKGMTLQKMFYSSPPSATYSREQSVNWVSIGSDHGLWPIWRQAIISTSAGLWSIGSLGTNFSEILIKIQIFSLTKMHLKMLSAISHQSVQEGNVLTKGM